MDASPVTPAPDGRSPDQRLADVIAAADGDASFELEDLIRLTGAPPVLLEAVAREGLLVPHHLEDGRPKYTLADVEALRAGLILLERGLPFPELVRLGRLADTALGGLADAAADAFHRFVRDPAVADRDPDEAASRLVDAYHVMLPSAIHVVAHRLRRRMIATAASRLGVATDPEG